MRKKGVKELVIDTFDEELFRMMDKAYAHNHLPDDFADRLVAALNASPGRLKLPVWMRAAAAIAVFATCTCIAAWVTDAALSTGTTTLPAEGGRTGATGRAGVIGATGRAGATGVTGAIGGTAVASPVCPANSQSEISSATSNEGECDMNIVKSVSSAIGAATLAAAPAVAVGDLVAPSFGFATNRVEAGATATQSARVIVSPEGRLYKQGTGTWVLPAATIQQSWEANITVSEGTLEYQSGGTAPTAPADLSDAVKAKALLWVDAADPDETHFRDGESAATLGNLFTTWHDKRETDVSNPTYAYAKAYTGYATSYPRWKSISAGRAFNFGDKINSGVAMEWKMPDGTRFAGGNYSTSMVKVVFAVYNNYYQQSGATIFGSLSGNPSPFQGEGAKYWSSDSTWPTMVNGRTYVNGERIDGTTETQPAQSTKLIEGWQCWNKDVKTASFFGTGSKSTSGGSFLHEAIVFTNELTETERLEVETYLMSRWSPLSAGGCT